MSDHKTYDDGDWDKPTSEPAAVDGAELLTTVDTAEVAKMKAIIGDLERQLDKAKSQVRMAQDFRDNETERYAQAHENYIKVARLVNRFAADNPALKEAWDTLQPTLHQSINEQDKVGARVSMLASENEALKTINRRLERQLAAAETLCYLAADVLDSYASKEFYMGSGGGYRNYSVVTKTINALRSVANTATPPAADSASGQQRTAETQEE